jgi:hypothetical protein
MKMKTVDQLAADAEAVAERLDGIAQVGSAGRNARQKRPKLANPLKVELTDFYAYMPQHGYIFAPTRELWPAGSVNARVPPVDIGAADPLRATAWLDRHRPVEQMTWLPGAPMLIRDRLIAEGGFVERPSATVFNLYRAPVCAPGEADKAGPWLDHVARVYPDDAARIVQFLAHRVQRPGEKINHALLLGGAPGIGKDTILHPVTYAVGVWNFADVTPVQLLGRFNGYIKSVILRINEARDLGDANRFAFYEHTKPLTAAPPDFLRCDEKGLREYAVPNVTGVVITTNYLTDGCYLPPDDRRHYVAWSPLTEQDFPPGYFADLYRWFEPEGNRHVAAYLAAVNLATFDPQAPPPKTTAFWEIVDANRGGEESELADAVDALTPPGSNPPTAITIDDLAAKVGPTLAEWLRDAKNRRVVPKRLERVGYVRVGNPYADDRLWRIRGKRQAIYGRGNLTPRERQAAAAERAKR